MENKLPFVLGASDLYFYASIYKTRQNRIFNNSN